MANRRFQDVQALQREVKIITGVMGANVTAKPLGVSTMAIDSNNLVITLEDKYNDLVGISVIAKTLTSAFTHVDSVAFAASNKITIDADAAVNAADEFFITLFLKNTSVTN